MKIFRKDCKLLNSFLLFKMCCSTYGILDDETDSRYSYLCFYSLYDLVNIHLLHDASNIVAMQRVSIAV